MDENVIKHIESEEGNEDVLVFYDYRTLDIDSLPKVGDYEQIHLLAWSMGVWAAANVYPILGVVANTFTALNGTERPIDDHYGIPITAYTLTEKGLDERGREKFFQRMLSNREDMVTFAQNKPQRALNEQKEELSAIRQLSRTRTATLHWDKVYCSEKDIIFPFQNQQNWWQKRAPITVLPCGHYPFYCLKNWDDFIPKNA
ncbi:hypothetical protein FACS1894199_15360 [Bacteroidia bacterium]|nr:hypothetical protein FACS1894199_15360 [Bacteroidia bacterium]